MAATARLTAKQQTLEDAYAVPANFLEIDVCDAQTHGIANKRYTDYEVRMKVSDWVTASVWVAVSECDFECDRESQCVWPSDCESLTSLSVDSMWIWLCQSLSFAVALPMSMTVTEFGIGSKSKVNEGV